MATPLTDSINALTQYANETTGKQDTTLSDAVGSLVEGYGGVGDVSFEKIAEYIVPISWENDRSGNAVSAINALSGSIGNDTAVYVIIATNNTASQYRLVNIIFYGISKTSNNGGACLRYSQSDNSYNTRTIASSTSTWCSQGTILTLYKQKP